MHLKALTLRGFKSFASATTLRVEPGITCVVGPNGSGKSNVVDALSWVMGEQGAKSLRGGKMEDVIFAGTTGRPPLGRAEVSLTIDNSDGALPIDYAEVTITRIMFQGDSEYQINGDTCRLLDIQDLLSDSGIGREMHVIVGQGQLDSVLHADPMGRRAFIEEASGVLKHRKRKEKALRKLNAMQANLARVQDLADELRRQLKPLGRQKCPSPAGPSSSRPTCATPASGSSPTTWTGSSGRSPPKSPTRRPSSPARRPPGPSCATRSPARRHSKPRSGPSPPALNAPSRAGTPSPSSPNASAARSSPTRA
ncbi:Chromosome partition protein Smc [Streptomyces narbonensis]